MSPYVAHLARRVAEAPDFLASALTAFARSERLDDDALAARLGCATETLTHLRLCRTPRTQAPLFWEDVERIAQRFSVSPEVLAEIARRGQILSQLRGAGEPAQAPGFLLAARDGEREGKPPEETQP